MKHKLTLLAGLLGLVITAQAGTELLNVSYDPTTPPGSCTSSTTNSSAPTGRKKQVRTSR